ncbi:MAG: 4-phosphoerythronate dehydrogenase [Elusimicrobia bacterium]|nr:4-phosphoerythronate dehydrogenase [Elusimicrobiota bacterium]
MRAHPLKKECSKNEHERDCLEAGGRTTRSPCGPPVKIVVDENIPHAAEAFGALRTVQAVPAESISPGLIRDADALVVRSVTPVSRSLLEGSRIRFVASATTGFDHMDVDYLNSRGIAFAAAPGCNAESVADYVMAALLALHRRKKVQLDRALVGIVGSGRIGGRVAQRLEGLGVKTLLNDPPLARQTPDSRFRPLDDLMACDIVTLHTPLTQKNQWTDPSCPQGPAHSVQPGIDGRPVPAGESRLTQGDVDATFHLFDENRIARMKSGSVLINTARGGVVDTFALKKALQSGRLAGAVLDVWEGEPTVDAELLALVDLGTPHIAGLSWDGRVNGTVMAYDALRRHFGVPPGWTRPTHSPVVVRPQPCGDDLFGLLENVVRGVYDIEKDDREFRAKTGSFNALRDDYFKRRDFSAVTVVEADAKLKKKWMSIGFQGEKS